MQEIFNFLSELAANNNKEWFDVNRSRYQETRQQMLQFTEMLINEIRAFDPEVGYTNPKDCVFRIFRDVRFSKDKRPYKTNYGSFIAPGGRKGGKPGYYFHIEPGASFVGGGIYMPQPNALKAIRTEIYDHVDEFVQLINDDQFKDTFELYGYDKLKTAPKGFDKEWEYIDLLRYKSYAPFVNISDSQVLSSDYFEFLIGKFKQMSDFNKFLYTALDRLK